MSRITILSDDVANHIAAGEVIERPASVVKELIENALDAEATQIEIEIGVGGKSYLRITDNGVGMDREDAQLAFERHATSKLTATRDLASITTLGFRGEALPSIASVAKVKLLTRSADTVVGTRIDIHGGEIVQVMDSGAAPGTYIEVNELFYKTPARLKFLKSAATEFGYIMTTIMEEALAHPGVGFVVKNNGREQLNLPGKSDLLQRIAGLFGRDLIRDLTEVNEQAGDLELRGLIGRPTCHRVNRNFQKMFVNTRPVKDKTMTHAVFQAYENLIPRGRHPVAFLFLTLPAELVDVNVHPTKTEIRFVNSHAIHDLVFNVLRHTLGASVQKTALVAAANGADRVPAVGPQNSEEDFLPEGPSLFPSAAQPPLRSEGDDQSSETLPFGSSTSKTDIAPIAPHNFTTSHGLPRSGQFTAMKPIGQFYDTYLLVQDGEDLCIIDQHAAHERIYYERLKQQLQQERLEIQPLLFPITLDVSPREQAALAEYLSQLPRYGLELEHFGGATYLLKSVPALLARADHKKMVYDLLDRLVESEKTTSLDQMFDDILKLMACHGAIRAQQPLRNEQIFGLLKQLDTIEYPYTCPHGRPTVIKIGVQDLAKKFERT